MLGAPGCNERAVGGGKQSQQLAPPCHCIVQVLCVLFPVPCCAIISRQHWSVNSPSRLTHGHQKPPKLSSSFGNFRFAWKWDCVCIAVIHYAMEERQKLVKEEEEEIVVDIKLEEEKNYPPKVSRRGALKLITPLQLLPSCRSSDLVKVQLLSFCIFLLAFNIYWSEHCILNKCYQKKNYALPGPCSQSKFFSSLGKVSRTHCSVT